MGAEYGLYERNSKAFIWLGKRLSANDGISLFQMPAESIVAFMAEIISGKFEIHSDMGNRPDESGEWTRIAGWCDDDVSPIEIAKRTCSHMDNMQG